MANLGVSVYKSLTTDKGMVNRAYRIARKETRFSSSLTGLFGVAAAGSAAAGNAVASTVCGSAFGLNMSEMFRGINKMLDLSPAYKEIVARAKQIYKK